MFFLSSQYSSSAHSVLPQPMALFISPWCSSPSHGTLPQPTLFFVNLECSSSTQCSSSAHIVLPQSNVLPQPTVLHQPIYVLSQHTHIPQPTQTFSLGHLTDNLVFEVNCTVCSPCSWYVGDHQACSSTTLLLEFCCRSNECSPCCCCCCWFGASWPEVIPYVLADPQHAELPGGAGFRVSLPARAPCSRSVLSCPSPPPP